MKIGSDINTYLFLYVLGGHSGLAATDGSRSNAAGLLVALKDFTDASVRDAQRSADDAGLDALSCHFDNFQPHWLWQGSAVYEQTSQLVDPSLTCLRTNSSMIFIKFVSPVEH